jgi:hypothetical protein
MRTHASVSAHTPMAGAGLHTSAMTSTKHTSKADKDDRESANEDTDRDDHSKHSRKKNLRSNKHGAMRGTERATEVQGMNTKADANRGFTTSKGVQNASTAKTSRKAAASAQNTKKH